MVFSKLEVNPMFLENIRKQGFEEMFPVQKEAIPLALQGDDIVVQAKTGSGKTFAFAIPLCNKIDTSKREVQAIVLTPTRELAVQVHEEIDKLCEGTKIRSVPVYGGSSMNRQIQGIRGGAQVIIGTPGRVIDLMQRGQLHLDGVRVAVLDEGDRMFDMGFKDDIEYILSKTPREKQSMLFSATVPSEIQYLIQRNFSNPKEIRIGEIQEDVTQVEQVYVDCDFKERFNKLCNFIAKENISQAIIFCNAKHECDKLARNLKRYGFGAMSLHGDLSQNQRDAAMEAFRNKEVKLLIATDLAARGLDIDGVSHVINYDVPKETNGYVHRIGRTARAGRTGMAITFLINEDWDAFRRITSDLRLQIQSLDIQIAQDYFFRRDMEGDNRRAFGGRRDGRMGYGRDRRSRDFGGGDRRRDRRSGGFGRGNRSDNRGSFSQGSSNESNAPRRISESEKFERNRHYIGL